MASEPTDPGPHRLTLRLGAPVGTAVQAGTVGVPLTARRPDTLPPRPGPLTGRDAPLAAIAAAATGPLRAALLRGRPGSGRTATAVEAAYRLAPLFPDGVLGDCAEDRPVPAETLAARVLAGLGLPVPTHDAVGAVRAALAHRRVLIVLDDVADAAALDLLPPGTGSFLLLTSRTGLGPAEWHTVRVPLHDLRPDDARELLGRDEPGIDGLVELCGGLPLALRIAAARLAGGTPAAALVAELQTPHRALAALRLGDRGVRESFDATAARLAPQSRRVLRALGALPLADVTPATAAALAGIRTAEATAALDELADARLADARAGRYVLPPLVHRYAEDTLHDQGGQRAATAAADRVSRVYSARLERVQPGPGRVLDRAWFRVEWPNLVVLGRYLARTDRRRLDQLADAVADRAATAAPWPAWVSLQRRALCAARAAGPPERRAELQVRIGAAQRERGRPERALAVLEGSIGRYLQGGDRLGAATAALATANAHRDRGDVLSAAEGYHWALSALSSWGGAEAQLTMAWSLYGLGVLAAGTGDHRRAVRCQLAATDRFRLLDHGLGEALAWHALGDARRAAGAPDSAVGAYRRARDRRAADGQPVPARTLARLGEALAAQDRPQEAEPVLQEALRAAVAEGDQCARVLARRTLAVLAR